MTLMCLIRGCMWSAGTPMEVGGEVLVCQCCSRCGCHRYAPELTGSKS
nr:PSPA7_2676 family Cys-rich small protein [Pseudomonas sp. ML96]